MMTTASEKLQVVERELRMRRDVYPRWVANGKMSPQEAAYQIRVMEEIATDYVQLSQGERLL
jgi:hypothetical protein